MKVPSDHHPTNLELDILHVIWANKKSTVRQVVDGLNPERKLALTTVTTIMNRMVDKGWLMRSKQGPGRFVYTAIFSETMTKRSMLRNFIQRLFGGSAPNMIQNAIDSSDLDADELQEIAKLIEQAKKSKR
jgi:predicted transcriptional regulator